MSQQPQSQQPLLSRSTISNTIGLTIAALYTLAGQAHFTSRITPGLAAHVDEMTPNSHKAFWFLHMNYAQLKAFFGALDLIAAGLLWRRKTRKAGLSMAIVGFSGGTYGQWYSNGDTAQVAAFLALAVFGYVMAP